MLSHLYQITSTFRDNRPSLDSSTHRATERDPCHMVAKEREREKGGRWIMEKEKRRRRESNLSEKLCSHHWHSGSVQYFLAQWRENAQWNFISYHISITLTYMYSPTLVPSSIRLALKFRRGLSRCLGWLSERRPQQYPSSWRSWRPRGRLSRGETSDVHFCVVSYLLYWPVKKN